MAKDILFKPRVEAIATERIMHKTRHLAVQESTRGQKLHLNDMYVVVISCLHSILRLKT